MKPYQQQEILCICSIYNGILHISILTLPDIIPTNSFNPSTTHDSRVLGVSSFCSLMFSRDWCSPPLHGSMLLKNWGSHVVTYEYSNCQHHGHKQTIPQQWSRGWTWWTCMKILYFRIFNLLYPPIYFEHPDFSRSTLKNNKKTSQRCSPFLASLNPKTTKGP